MAGLYETLLQNYSPVFGNVAVTPASIATTNARIAGLQQNVADAQTALTQARDTYNSLVANSSNNGNRGKIAFRDLPSLSWGQPGSTDYLISRLKEGTNTTPPDTTAVTNAQNALTTAQTRLNSALARQEANRLAGEQAVQWGQTARNAEQQGIARAAQMYQQALQGEAVRNAIMNNAIGTVGNFNFGGGR